MVLLVEGDTDKCIIEEIMFKYNPNLKLYIDQGKFLLIQFMELVIYPIEFLFMK